MPTGPRQRQHLVKLRHCPSSPRQNQSPHARSGFQPRSDRRSQASADLFARAIYLLALFVLLSTGYLVLAGTRALTSASDLARFGSAMFALLAPLQLIVLTSLAAVSSASSVAQEKDRRTLLLLLMTRLSGGEIVTGKCAASLLGPLSMLLAALPLFLALPLLGGVAVSQVVAIYAVTLVSVILAAAVGTVIGLWREKTFQAIATTVLVLTLYVVALELAASGVLGEAVASAATWFSPLAAIADGLNPFTTQTLAGMPQATVYSIATLVVAVLIVIFGIARVRVWNPSREVQLRAPEPETGSDLRELLASSESAGTVEIPATINWKVRAPRRVWDNPVLWREICTWAYGRKVIIVRLAFIALFAVAAATIYFSIRSGEALRRFDPGESVLPVATLPVAAIAVISLVLVNARSGQLVDQ